MNFIENHKNYINSLLFGPLPFSGRQIDTQKMLILYMLVGASKILKMELDTLSITNFIISTACKTEDKIYAFRPNNSSENFEPNMVHSFCALAALKMLNFDIDIIDKQQAQQWIDSLINENGTIRIQFTSTECDLRMTYSAVHYLEMLGIELVSEKVIDNILQCQNPDGGFGLAKYSESHGGATYCAVASLLTLKQEIPNKDRLIQWLMNRHIDLGIDDHKQRIAGFQGRIGKVPDSCYAFWCGWTLSLLGMDHLVERNPLKNFLELCASKSGGFSKTPLSRPDPVHTFHSLLGLFDSNEFQNLSNAMVE